MSQRAVIQPFDGRTLSHVLVTDGEDPRPGVIIFPTVIGVSPLEIGFAERLAALGYAALIADLYGRRFTPGVDRDAAFAAMGALRADRRALRARLLAVLDWARTQPEIDAARIAASGYCFGGQCALDLARSGVDIAGVASFHGLFDPPGLTPVPIRAKVIAFHGWDDPMVAPAAVTALAELTEAGCDWQIHGFGHVGHGFTNPGATGAAAGVRFDENAARRSWTMFVDYLAELFG
jgi:dienelactone hydrolase